MKLKRSEIDHAATERLRELGVKDCRIGFDKASAKLLISHREQVRALKLKSGLSRKKLKEALDALETLERLEVFVVPVPVVSKPDSGCSGDEGQIDWVKEAGE